MIYNYDLNLIWFVTKLEQHCCCILGFVDALGRPVQRKAVGFTLLGPLMSVQYFVAIHPIVIQCFELEHQGGWLPDRQTYIAISRDMLPELRIINNVLNVAVFEAGRRGGTLVLIFYLIEWAERNNLCWLCWTFYSHQRLFPKSVSWKDQINREQMSA